MVDDSGTTSPATTESFDLDVLVAWLQHAPIVILDKLLANDVPTQADVFGQRSFAQFVENRAEHPLPRVEPKLNRQSLSIALKRFMKGELPAGSWRSYAETRVNEGLGRDGSFHLWSQMWDLLGKWAWLDPAFQRKVTERAEAYFWQRAFIPLGEFTTIRFAPNTCWLLLAIAAAVAERSRRSKGEIDQAAVGVIREVAEQLGLRPGYAGLWDQWVLLEARYGWYMHSIPPSILEALAELPLDSLPADSQKPVPSAKLATVDWNHSIPSWFNVWFIASRRAKKTSRAAST